MTAGLGGSAQALKAYLPHMQNPNMEFTGPFEGDLYTRTDVLPQGRPWFPSLGPSYGAYADPWFAPKGQVIVKPTARPVTK
ncbi:hypothetical protein [Ancylobacter sp. SL191]|uniref:hypothetical protein n=1 Tax=Ancylobacter sp. SL191 TaxID=2995166 RepID=UPI0022703293|nr:hypothetical protein [Ancylobacter sp. SL191]WAC26503.1 hypothetical protein OU996_15975 [Ancylobacter sp. SL191]